MNNFKILAVVLSCVFSSMVAANECWDLAENQKIKGFSELDDELLLSFKDSVSCEPLKNMTVDVMGHTLKTDYRGYVTMSMDDFWAMDDEDVPIKVAKRGYITLETALKVRAGSVWNKRFVMSKKLDIGNVRFVLQWQDTPMDLDLNLVANDFHISYQKSRSIRNRARLDRDDMNGYGPETITLARVNKNKTYKVYVHNYRNDKPFDGRAVLYVYADNKLVETIAIPKTKRSQRYVDLLELSGNEIRVINRAR